MLAIPCIALAIFASWSASDRVITVPCASIKVNISLYSGPGSTYRLIDLVECGEEVTVVEEETSHRGWLKVRTKMGRDWYVAVATLSRTTGNTQIVQSGGSASVSVLNPATKIQAGGSLSDGKSRAEPQAREESHVEFANVAGPEHASQTSKTTLGCNGEESVSMFAAPQSSVIVRRAACGEEVTVLERSTTGDRLKVRSVRGYEGYVRANAISPAEATSITALGLVGNAGPLPSQSNVFRVGDGATPPEVIYRVEPQYTKAARDANFNGTVLVRLVVDPEGGVQDPKVVKAVGLGLDEKALEAVRLWKFKPGMKDGHAIPVDAAIQITFRLLDETPFLPDPNARPSLLTSRNSETERTAGRGSPEAGGYTPHAQYEMGLKYISGDGVLQDYVIAHMWLNLAAARSFPGAAAKRDELAKLMTPSQIADAQAQARNWKPE